MVAAGARPTEVAARRAGRGSKDSVAAGYAGGKRLLKQFQEETVSGFRGFLLKTNAMALAIAVIIGLALGNVINSHSWSSRWSSTSSRR